MESLSIRKSNNGHQFFVEDESRKIIKVFYSMENAESYIKGER